MYIPLDYSKYLTPYGHKIHVMKHGNMSILYPVSSPPSYYRLCKFCYK